MSVVSKATLKTYFQDGKEPDENKFIDLIDTMALISGVPGDFTIGDGTGSPYLLIDGGVLNWRGIKLQTGGSIRWAIEETAHAESGGNAGSDFKIARFNDAGEYVDDSFYIYRNTGDIEIANDFYNTPWSDWAEFTTTLGWASFTTKQILYKVVGHLVFVKYAIIGPSDDVGCWFTLPHATSEDEIQTVSLEWVKDGGTIKIGVRANDTPPSSVVRFFPAIGFSGWLNTGTKQISGMYIYEI
jgi:hypothetical protein